MSAALVVVSALRVALVAAGVALTASLEARAAVFVACTFTGAMHKALAADGGLHLHGSAKRNGRQALPRLWERRWQAVRAAVSCLRVRRQAIRPATL